MILPKDLPKCEVGASYSPVYLLSTQGALYFHLLLPVSFIISALYKQLPYCDA